MAQSFVLSAKRGTTAALGLVGLAWGLGMPYANARDARTWSAWVALAVHVVGPVVAIALLSRWSHWGQLRPDTRFGLVVGAASGLQVLALPILRVESLTFSVFDALIVALGAAAFWWVGWGQRLDEKSVASGADG